MKYITRDTDPLTWREILLMLGNLIVLAAICYPML